MIRKILDIHIIRHICVMVVLTNLVTYIMICMILIMIAGIITHIVFLLEVVVD